MNCLRWSHANPVEARSVGWHVLSDRDPSTVPTLLAGLGWVLLGADGKLTSHTRQAA